MIIELVGLPGSGKTTRAREMAREHGTNVVAAPVHVAALVVEGFLGVIKRPVAAFCLLVLIMKESNRDIRRSLLVNGWLGSSAKYWRARHGGVIDQGYAQTLIGVLPKASDARTVACVLAGVRRDVELVWCDADPSVRASRLAQRPYQPRQEFGDSEVKRFSKESERAYRDIREIAAKIAQRAAPTGLFHHTLKLAGYLFAYCISRFHFARRDQVAALMYHSIDRSGWKLSVTPETFERQMKYLARKGRAVPLAGIVAYVRGEKELPAHAIAVTFDDGYRDLLTTALPILERHRIPATVFVPSDLSARTDPDGRPRLTGEELRTLSRSPLITVGSHAKSHRKFTELTPEEMQNELKESADELAQITGECPRFFAYPFGARSAEAESAVRSAGYEAAFGISEGTIHGGDNLFCLKRVQIDSTMSFLLFRLRLTSALDWNRRIVDLFRSASY